MHVIHTLSILQHVSAHHTYQHQAVFLVVIITACNGPLCDTWTNPQRYPPHVKYARSARAAGSKN